MADTDPKEVLDAHSARPGPTENWPGESQALAILAHELRNPLAPIRNGAEVLRTICTDPRQVQVVEIMSRQIVHLTRLLDDLLETARLRRGIVLLQRQSVDVGSIVQDALDAIRPAIDARRQTLVVSLPATPIQMNCDPTRLVQVLQNLLDNANRFTAEGGALRLKAEVVASELVLEVSDNGEGVDPALLARLFNVFTQGEQPLHRPQGGLGVGLAIARNIIEMHGGTIGASSEGRGLGSQFVIKLPIEQSHADVATFAANATSLHAVRTLVVDDQPLIVATLAQYLETRGYLVTVAESGAAALKAVEDVEPRVAVLDIGLPDMNGFELARQLRERFPAIVLIAVSGYSWDMLRDPDPGLFARYLAKPISPATIASTIEFELHETDRASRSV
jgi:CheY-like chemotaxis protein